MTCTNIAIFGSIEIVLKIYILYIWKMRLCQLLRNVISILFKLFVDVVSLYLKKNYYKIGSCLLNKIFLTYPCNLKIFFGLLICNSQIPLKQNEQNK
jgi:hypothetical protein